MNKRCIVGCREPTWFGQRGAEPTGHSMGNATASRQFCASGTGFRCGSTSSLRSPPWSTRRCLGMLSATKQRTTASSSTLVQEDCDRQRLERFSLVRRGPTSATEPSVQLDLQSGTICRRTSDLSYSRFRQLLKTFLFGQWDQSAALTRPF